MMAIEQLLDMSMHCHCHPFHDLSSAKAMAQGEA